MPFAAGTVDQAPLQEILGYLNFSSGASDPAFLKRLNALWGSIEATGEGPEQSWTVARQLLLNKLEELAAAGGAFRNSEQARSVLRLIFDHVLPAYREHHRDLLFHQTDAALWRPFFVGRVAEAVLSAEGPWDESQRIVDAALRRLNDYLGYRPVPVLETHKHEPYPHERVRPVPLFIAGAGVSVGKYHDLVEQTLTILRNTDPDLLDAAWFELDALEELALDPRAYDFNHPANRRPNYHFGGWDPHRIDNKGRYRRFVIQQCTLDAVLARVDAVPDVPREQLLYEAGAVLAGTMLMASGTTGSGPDAHDSSVSLATLLPRIARYRDEFYERLFSQPLGEHRKRLEEEAAARRQPFAGARQHLNAQLARLRALQMQHVQLALIFARLGFSDAAMRQANIVPAASARMVCQMQCLLTSGHRAADAGRLADAFAVLPQVEDLLHRAIECGAVIDPWNILGFGGNFSLFPAVENSIPDSRVDELLDLIEQIYALYARLWHEAATADNVDLLKRLPQELGKLAQWWDHFATTAVSGVRPIFGHEEVAAAKGVAGALAAWHKAGEAAGQVAFWQPHVEEFRSPHAYGRVIEVLLDKGDLQAAMALLMHWLSQANEVNLDEGPRGFYALCLHWLQAALVKSTAAGAPPTDHAIVLKFFDYLEANADVYWQVPHWQVGEFAAAGDAEDLLEASGLPDEEVDPESDDEEDRYSAAYENVVFRDSTADGIDADMLEVPGADGETNDELERQQQWLSGRLAFLAMLSTLRKMVALSAGGRMKADGGRQKAESKRKKSTTPSETSNPVPAEWSISAKANHRGLLKLAAALQRQPLAVSSAKYDALLEYDRHRLVYETLLEKVIATIVGTAEVELMLAAVSPSSAGNAAPQRSKGKRSIADRDSPAAGPSTVAIWSAVQVGDAQAVRARWGAFLAELSRRPLLYVPLSRGGDAGKIAAARGLQQSLRELLRRLPRLGLLRETCQLLRIARVMEQKHPQGAGAVTEFDRLFEIGYKSIVESLVESSLNWGAEPQAAPRRKAEVGRRKNRIVATSDAAIDAQLIDCLQQVTESLLLEWLAHSRTLRLSVLERVVQPKPWQELVKFIERYGHDLFTQQFFHLGNLRAILHHGVDKWLEQLADDDDAGEQFLLIKELDHGLSRAEAKKHLSLVIEAIVENYTEYRDYNATTTQSDRGEMLHSLLNFLRVKMGYERIHWNLRPAIVAHEVLVRRGCSGAAELWRRAMRERTSDVAEQQLQKLAGLQTQYGMRLPTIADRLAERFVRPLAIDRVRALVAPAADEARRGVAPVTFAALEQEAGELAQEPCGAGLDLPDWLEMLEEEVERVGNSMRGWNASADADQLPWTRLTWDEIQLQLTDWDTPPEVDK